LTGVVASHCHLDYLAREGDLEAAIARARTAGVSTMLTISTRLDSFPDVLTIAQANEGVVWCSVGVHPHDADDHAEIDMTPLLEGARHPEVVAIGETGLDYYYDNSDRAAQRRCFRTHIEAAKAAGLPVIVHTRDADDDTIKILEEGAHSGGLNGVIHCFSTTRKLAEKTMELGFYISLAGILTFKRSEVLREIAAAIPDDRLLVETDAPYLAPVPKRGKRNEPANVVHTLKTLAELKQHTMAEMTDITSRNFFTLFDKATPE